MNNLKNKINLYNQIRYFFAIVFLIGLFGFFFFSMGMSNVIRNGLISVFLMAFGAIEVKYYGYKISLLAKKLKNKNNHTTKKIIEFNKIA